MSIKKGLFLSKGAIRKRFKEVLRALPLSRREEARNHLLAYLEPHLARFSSVGSFVSLPYEVDMTLVNGYLEREKKLSLPRVFLDTLEILRVQSLEKDLIKGKWGFLEPNPKNCEKTISFDCLLVPALAFDERGVRIGYGAGHYDKLLAQNQKVYTIGVGFREQLSHDLLPKEDHDIAVSELCLL